MKGAFTGANENRQGLFQAAHGGTLFMDEIGNMSLTMQVKLYRVLQEGKVRPIGSTEESDVDVRIIAATNKDFEKEIAEGRFREDLYYRLSVIPIQLPASARAPRGYSPAGAAFPGNVPQSDGKAHRGHLAGGHAPAGSPTTGRATSANWRTPWSAPWPSKPTGEISLRVLPDRIAGYSSAVGTGRSRVEARSFPAEGRRLRKGNCRDRAPLSAGRPREDPRRPHPGSRAPEDQLPLLPPLRQEAQPIDGLGFAWTRRVGHPEAGSDLTYLGVFPG